MIQLLVMRSSFISTCLLISQASGSLQTRNNRLTVLPAPPSFLRSALCGRSWRVAYIMYPSLRLVRPVTYIVTAQPAPKPPVPPPILITKHSESTTYYGDPQMQLIMIVAWSMRVSCAMTPSFTIYLLPNVNLPRILQQ